jgi:hypothetical protein
MMTAGACAGPATERAGVLIPESGVCRADVALERFLTNPSTGESALDAWWEATTWEAARLFHAPGIAAPERRAFFDLHVFTEFPTLVVGDDAFELSEAFALAGAADLLGNGRPDDASQWLLKAERTVEVVRCQDAIRRAGAEDP